jgi:hypothetical protein
MIWFGQPLRQAKAVAGRARRPSAQQFFRNAGVYLVTGHSVRHPAVFAEFGHIIEEGEEPIVVALRDGAEFVIVAMRALPAGISRCCAFEAHKVAIFVHGCFWHRHKNCRNGFPAHTGSAEYVERGVEALRSQFPGSPSENWVHAGYGHKVGVSSSHWGTGSGMAGIEFKQDYLSDAVCDVHDQRCAGDNGLNVTKRDIDGDRIDVQIDSPYLWTRKPEIIFHGTQPARKCKVYEW